MTAEINRNLEDFDTDAKTIQSVDGNNFDWIKDIILRDCKNRNSSVVQLPYSD